MLDWKRARPSFSWIWKRASPFTGNFITRTYFFYHISHTKRWPRKRTSCFAREL